MKEVLPKERDKVKIKIGYVPKVLLFRKVISLHEYYWLTNDKMNIIFKNKQISIFLILTLLLFTNCKEVKVENCITDMYIKYISENPGPDVVVFKIISNYKQLSLDIESFESIEVTYNNQDVYRDSAQFELEKVSRNDYILTWMTPYFAQKGYHTEKEIHDFYERNESLKIVLTNEKETFTFVKCTK